MRYRLIKPQWGKEILPGPSTLESDYSQEFVLSKNRDGYNAYYFPNHNSQPTKGKWLSGKEVDVFNWVFVDMDLKDGVYADKGDFLEKVSQFPVEPSRIVDSGNGIHVYWKVKELTREAYVELQFRLINHFQTDTSVWTVLQLMRVPGSINTKNKDNFIPAQLLVDNKNVYTVDTLAANLPEMVDSQKEKMNNHLNKLDGYAEMVDLEALDSDELPDCFEKLLESDQYVRNLWNADKGERSDADWKLAHLLFEKDYHKLYEALPVLLNTKKARSKGNFRKEYAFNTIAKVYSQRENFSVPSVTQMKGTVSRRDVGQRIKGPTYFDGTQKGWRKGEVIGMIAGPGVGKTTATLDIFYEMMKANPESDDRFVFFSLEMQDWEIIERWEALVGQNSPYSDRLHVVSNEDENGLERHINLQKLFWYVDGIKRETGKEVGAIAIDHIGVVDTSIDVSKKPNFGIMGEDLGFGTTRRIPFEALCAKMKNLAKQLNTLIVLQSQTTKGRAKDGDTELGADAAFGTARFEWYVDYIMTFWQPLRRVEAETDLKVLAWQYCKIRNKHPEDRVKIYHKKVLKVDLSTGKLEPLALHEMEEFKELEERASKLRAQADKKAGAEYTNSDGGFKRLKAIIGSKLGNTGESV